MAYNLPGTKSLILGGTGTGKTHSIRTLVDAGVTPMILFTEPGMEVLADLPTDKVHWKYVRPAASSFDAMKDSAQKINTMSMKALSSLEGVNKQQHNQWVQLMESLASFTCDRTGENFGNIDEWDQDKALVIDSLSGLNIMAMDLVTGSKPMKSQADWGIAMDNLERLINHLTIATPCHFVLTSHLERENDEVTGGVQLMASTLGRKLAPKLPRYFGDVVLARRENNQFYWSTTAPNVDLKTRNLPFSDKLEPSFTSIVGHWRERQGLSRHPQQEEAAS